MATCTFILLNYRRSDNLRKLIDSINGQNLKTKIILIDNSDKNIDIKVDKKIFIPWNGGCFTRLFFLPYVNTEYICFIDDDLQIMNDNSLEKWLNIYSHANAPIIGGWGALANSDGYNSKFYSEDNYYNILKGRHMLFRRDILLNFSIDFRIILNRDLDTFEILKRADDIYFSLLISKGKPILYSCPSIREELIDNEELSQTGLWSDSIHKTIRSDFSKYLMTEILVKT